MQILNFNTISFALVGGLVAFGIVFGENRVRIVSLGSLLGLFALTQLSDSFFTELTQKGIFGFHPSVAQAQAIMLGVVVLLFALGSMIGVHDAGKKGRSVILSILTALLLIAFSVALLPVSDRTSLTTDYNLAALAYSSRFYILLGFSVWLIVTQFASPKKSKGK